MLDEATERAVLRGATELVSVSEGYAGILSGRVGRRVLVITNGFDPVDFRGKPVSERPLATYVGTYYPDRQDLTTVLRALGDLTRSGGLAGLRIRFVGSLPRSLWPTFVSAGLSDSVEYTGFVAHHEALDHIERSMLLLLAGPATGRFPRSTLAGNIASKVFEYLGSGRPILYVGDANSEVEALLRPFPGVAYVRPGDAQGAREAILSLARSGPTVNRNGLEPYTRRSLTGQLADVLAGACQGAPDRGTPRSGTCAG